ncbi:transposase, partial [Enterococcus faecalis]|uniref:transposase n=1 Tax=Enterococcus faecalis TaxID=1351 RepID=UPI003D6A7458
GMRVMTRSDTRSNRPAIEIADILRRHGDADDLDHLRSDPAFKLACGRLPDTGRDLFSQPTLSRLENAPRLRDVIRLTYTLV